MNRTALRRGFAAAASAAALVGVVAVGQPASAASGPTTPSTSSAPAPAPAGGIGASSASDAGTRNEGGVSTQHLDGACNLYSNGDGDLCLWYLRNFVGSRADFFFADSNLNNNVFVSAGSGQGQRVGNNSQSVWNYDRNLIARVSTGINGTGISGNLFPNSGGNFNATFIDNVESFTWI